MYILFNQHGETNLISLMTIAYPLVKTKGQFDVMYVDFSAAFDSIMHNKLLRLFSIRGVDDRLVDWISSYLTNWKCYILINDFITKVFYTPLTGIPQGAILAQLFYNFYISTMEIDQDTDYTGLFADDTKLGNTISELEDSTRYVLRWTNWFLWLTFTG